MIKIKVAAPSGTIILDRPEKRNALSRELLRQLAQAFSDLHQERSVRAVILTGSGSAFCAGMDLAEMLETAESDDAQQMWYEDSVQYKDLLEQMLRFPKPIIAAVNGPAIAGGAGLVLACDLVVASQDARFGLPEPMRGLVAGLVSPLLHFRIGGGLAARLLLMADLIDARQAEQWRLFHELVAPDMVWARAHEIAGTCAKSAPEALQLTKRMINETLGDYLTTMLSAGAAVSATARTTEAAHEGLQAFLEKREPNW